jgi:hypothetical protein
MTAGRGVWPTMSVLVRVRCFDTFIKAMVARRRDIVRLIM